MIKQEPHQSKTILFEMKVSQIVATPVVSIA